MVQILPKDRLLFKEEALPPEDGILRQPMAVPVAPNHDAPAEIGTVRRRPLLSS